MKKRILFFALLTIFFLAISKLYSQEEDYSRAPDQTKKLSSRNLKDRLVFGGGAGMQFGDETDIMVAPKVGYYLTDKIVVGVGLMYEYYSIDYDRIYGFGGIYSTNVYGGSLFADYFIYKNFFLHLEPELINYQYGYYTVDANNNYTWETGRMWVGSYFVGGGFRQRLGRKGYVQIMLLYNLNYNSNLSPYPSPWVPSISFMF